MVRTTSAKQTASSTPAAAPAPTPVVESKDVSAKKSSKKAAKPAEVVATPAPAPVVVAPVATPAAPVVAAPAAAAETKVEESKTLSSDAILTSVDAKIQQVSSILASLKNDSKALRKEILANKKAFEKLEKKSAKKKRAAPAEGEEAKPRTSGFMRPVKISDELASFLGKAAGTVMGRQDANDEIRQYVALHNLKETEKGKGRNINPDAKLSSLLKLPSGEQLTYFNLQKYMKPHFIRIEDAVVATA
jgi:chromatin remodeling complex protein RSC6